jgi:hypothetical protein
MNLRFVEGSHFIERIISISSQHGITITNNGRGGSLYEKYSEPPRFFVEKSLGGIYVGNNTRICNRRRGCTTADLACKYCLYYAGARRGCRLSECFCMEERQTAERREREERLRRAPPCRE